MEQLADLVKQRRRLERRQHLFRQGDRLESLYVVKSGSLKGYETTADGLEQIVGFYFPGEVLGLDGLGARQHNCAAVALETTVVCELSLIRLVELCEHCPTLHREMCRIVGNEIAADQDMFLLLAQRSAEERLATFLLSLSRRFRERGFSELDFNLSMTHQDIASFLGLTPQTLSRLFATFRDEGLINTLHRRVHINDIERLCKIAKLCVSCPAARQPKAA